MQEEFLTNEFNKTLKLIKTSKEAGIDDISRERIQIGAQKHRTSYLN